MAELPKTPILTPEEFNASTEMIIGGPCLERSETIYRLLLTVKALSDGVLILARHSTDWPPLHDDRLRELVDAGWMGTTLPESKRMLEAVLDG